MIERFSKLPSHRRLLAIFWILNAIIVMALLLFVIRGYSQPVATLISG